MPTSLSSLVRHRQRESLRQADLVAAAADRALSVWWGHLNAILQHGPRVGLPWTAALVRRHFQDLPMALAGGLRTGLTDLVRWGYSSARDGLLRTLPGNAAKAVVRRRVSLYTDTASTLFYAGVTGYEELRLPGSDGARGRDSRNAEDYAQRSHTGVHNIRSFVQGGYSWLKGDARRFAIREDRTALDYLSGLAQPIRDYAPRLHAPTFGDLSDDDSRTLLKSFVLPTPSEDKVRRHVERLIQPFLAKPRADLVPPQQLAEVVIQHYAAGKTQEEIAELLMPHVNGVASSARRVARTWGTYVANATQLETSERLSDVIIGYTIHSAKKTTSRPEHVRRDGTQYFRNPGPGQLGFDVMPKPPLEADGTIAWRCLCWLTPIFREVA